MRNITVNSCLLLVAFMTSNDTTYAQDHERSNPLRVIFETDMGNDIDDALALDMLYKYADEGKVKLLAVSTNNNSVYSIRYLDILNTWYGYPDIPLAAVKEGVDSEGDAKNYTKIVSEYAAEGKPVFKGSITDYSNIPEATRLYRKVLSEQPGNSVIIVSVGFSTNIARLLDTPPDEFSPLPGKELVAQKVKLLSIMAGEFEPGTLKEYNVKKDPDAARKVFAEWPSPIVVSPHEVGAAIRYPASSITNDFTWTEHHPVVIGYENYMKMPYDRPTYDLTSVLYAVEEKEDYFELSPPGVISVDDSSYTHFREDPGGMHRYLKISPDQISHVRDRFVEIISTKPKHQE